jgi:hypothetical protein
MEMDEEREREKKRGDSIPLVFACDEGHRRLLFACLCGVARCLFEIKMLTSLHVLYYCCYLAPANARMKWSTTLNSYVVLVVAMAAVVAILARGGVVARLTKRTMAQ